MNLNPTRRGALRLAAAGAGAVLMALSGAALAADFPARQIELIVPFQPGGGTDGVARAFGEAARKHIPQSIVVLNKQTEEDFLKEDRNEMDVGPDNGAPAVPAAAKP